MKKYLMILSGISAIGIGAIANTINNQVNQASNIKSQDKKFETITLSDIVKYDISDGTSNSYELNNLLTGLKDLNQYHKENNVKFEFSGYPEWIFTSDEGSIIISSYGFESFENLPSLINSNLVEFKNISIVIDNMDNSELSGYQILLRYKIADIEQSITLFSYYGYRNEIPLKQNHMEVKYSGNYSWLKY